MHGLSGKRGATDRASAIAANGIPSNHHHGRGTCDHHLCPRSNGRPHSRLAGAWNQRRRVQGLPAGLVSGVVEPPQGLQICEVSFVTARPPPRT